MKKKNLGDEVRKLGNLWNIQNSNFYFDNQLFFVKVCDKIMFLDSRDLISDDTRKILKRSLIVL